MSVEYSEGYCFNSKTKFHLIYKAVLDILTVSQNSLSSILPVSVGSMSNSIMRVGLLKKKKKAGGGGGWSRHFLAENTCCWWANSFPWPWVSCGPAVAHSSLWISIKFLWLLGQECSYLVRWSALIYAGDLSQLGQRQVKNMDFS